jgi:Cof subfamily protein (haloacid dehalogenase superfamily)
VSRLQAPRVLALDVDGTLMRSDNTLSDANRRAVARALAAGWRVVLATGKPPWAIAPLARALGLPGPHVVANGAATWSAAGGTRLRAEIGRADAVRALEFAAAGGTPRAVSGPNGVFVEDGWGAEAVDRALAEVGEAPATRVASALAAEPHLWKVITIRRAGEGTPEAEAPPLATALWVRTAPPFFEAVPRGASKAAALQDLCAGWGVGPERVLAFGDSDNDIEALRWAGVGVAMGQAAERVRRAADMVTATNDQDGVALMLERFLDR